MPAQGRVDDHAKIPQDKHGNKCCPHVCEGPAKQGSPDVHVNGKQALRVTDPGVHSKCCGANTWKADQGSSTCLINGLPAHRIDDRTKHCGGNGKLIQGSPDTIVGGPPS